MPLLEVKQEVLISDFQHFEHNSFLIGTGNAAKLHSKYRIKMYQLTMNNASSLRMRFWDGLKVLKSATENQFQ
jgi:hypothetical protein